MYALPDVDEVVAVAKELGIHLSPDEAVKYRKYLIGQMDQLDTLAQARLEEAALTGEGALAVFKTGLFGAFSDWNTVHHTFTYANAVDQALLRVPSKLLARGIFDGAMSVYLERFLNVPRQPVPEPTGRDARREDVLAAIDSYGGVDETAQLVADMIATARQEEVIQALGHALLREDAAFHQFQIYEAGVRQYR